MIRSWRACLLLTTGLVLRAPFAHADDAVDPYALTPEQLFHATVISASRAPEDVWEAPTAIYVISAADIERAGATSIPEALRLAPGVDVARINTSGWAVSIRGFNSALANKLLVLIDGRETYDPLFSGVYWDVQDTAIEDIDRIEVIRGPGASLWGANAVNGVINIITKRAADTQGPMLSATAGAEQGLTARYGGAFGGASHWRIYGRALDRDSGETLSGDDDHSEWQALRGGFRADLSLDNRNEVTLQGDLYHSQTGQLRAVPSFSAPFNSLQQETITAQGGNILARWTHEMGANSRIITQAYVDITQREQAFLEDQRTTYDLDVQYDLPTLGVHDVIAGVRYRNTSDEVTQGQVITSGANTHRSQLLSAFVQDQITLSPTWRLTVGSKFDDNDYTGFEIQPSVRLQWMGDGQMAWAAVSRAVRSPSELERQFNILFAAGPPIFLGTVATTIELEPSKQFDSEALVSYELGYRRQWSPELAMDIALFHNEYDGLSTLTPLPASFALDPPRFVLIPIAIANSTSARTDGVEVLLDWRVRDNLDIAASYSFLNMDLDGPPAPLAIDSEIAEGQSPRNQASLRVRWDATDRMSVDGALYYVDNLPAFQIDAYVRFDLRLAWRLSDHVQFEMVGQNLLDDAHREFGAPSDANAAVIERSVFGRLSWRH